MESHFETLGYSMDFYVDKKYIGSLKNVEKDRETFGYSGREKSIINKDLVLDNKKQTKIKAGTEVITELIPICGNLIDKK